MRDQLGRPIRDLRISVTDRCNFRCGYCMPAEIYGDAYKFLPRTDLLTFEEIERVARAGAALGVKKLRLTGGEPLLRAELPELIRMLAAIDGIEDISLTTNGFVLAGFAEQLKASGLHRVTVSLDSLDEEVFKSMSGRRYGTAPVLKGIEAAAEAGLGPIKINAVVQRGVNDHTVLGMVEHFRGTPHVLRFIEYMDVGTLNGWKLDEVVPAKELVEQIHARWPLEPVDPNYRGEVAKRYRFRDGQGEIGMITSVTQPFCTGCTRARLSPEGKLVTCLFAADGHDLRALLRDGATDADLRHRLESIWTGRTDRYSEIRTEETAGGRKIEMYQLGG
ncbi:MAG: GTP 3',8-cyclase MoaA [Planctomycetota bacterium]